MKKYIIAFAVVGAHWHPGHAQTIRTMTEQLTALNALQHSLQKGYSLVSHGLEGIGDRQDGEYHQHLTWYNSLYVINPTIYSPTNQSYAKNYDNAGTEPADNSRKAPNSGRPD